MASDSDRYFTARTLAIFMGALGTAGGGLAAWMAILGAGIGVVAVLGLSALVLVPLAIVEWRVPVIEIADGRIVMRQARLRAPFVVERPPSVALDVRGHLLGFQIVAVNGEAWVKGRLGELGLDGGKGLLVPARALAPSAKKRLEGALREWAARSELTRP